jgi:dTDP-glucose 4,6-dehydratase
MNILITGGAGFIGSHVVRLFVKKYTHYQIFNLDALTYAGNLENLKDIETAPNYRFLKGSINDKTFLKHVFSQCVFDAVIHLAAESHVDRSIHNPTAFAETNIIGTLNLLECCKQQWQHSFSNQLFYHISTDEVYGSLGESGFFSETSAYDPNSPYSASKASSDHFVRAYGRTYGLPYVISNCSNNYGPNQFPEKLIPLCIHNIINRLPLPVYGDGNQIRDWLYVEDHAQAIDHILHHGKAKETYAIGSNNEQKNINLVRELIRQMDKKVGNPVGFSEKLITFVKDRPGHDNRYALDTTKINQKLGWKPITTFEEGLTKTIDWYLSNKDWLENIASGAYQEYYTERYKKRSS